MQYSDLNDYMKKLFTILSIFIYSILFGRDYNNSSTLSGGDILSTQSLDVQCHNYDNYVDQNTLSLTAISQRNFVLENEYALIQLQVSQSNQNPIQGTALVKLNLTYQYEINGYTHWSTSQEVNLSINKDGSSFTDIDYIKIDGALRVKVDIISAVGVSSFPGIKLTLSCRGSYFDLLNPDAELSNIHYTAPATRADGGLVNGNLLVNWDQKLVENNNQLITPEVYELEWTYLSDPEGDEKVYLRDFLFRNNSSRIVTSNHFYFIPLVYEKGIIVFRVRAVGKNIVDGKLVDVKSQWSISENLTGLSTIDPNHKFVFQGLEINLNWQSTITFAEEGKNKAVINYHDGTLRSRQALTRVNTDQRVVLGETYYDYNGRAQLQVVPVPVEGLEENNFDFRPSFNVSDPQKGRLEKADYDIATPGQSCEVLAPMLNTSIGASNYYSTENKFNESDDNTGQNVLNKSLIPNAEQYPYVQTQYRNDNTGRIAAQSGVGKAHILGAGHETKYTYGAPNQNEITRLFGKQVGVSGRYKKNMVIDPNGQVSVSYISPAGQVVATALAGENETNLESLAGENDRHINAQLLSTTSNILDSDKKGKTFQYIFLVSSQSEHTFKYELEAGTHLVSCTGIQSEEPIDLKLSGVFHVELSLYDKCQQNTLFTKVLDTEAAFGPQASIQSKTVTEVVPANAFVVGREYTLVKTLRIDDQKLDNYLAEYLDNDEYTCVLKEQDFLDEALSEIDFTGCNLSCGDCITRIDALIGELESGGVSVASTERVRLYERCDVLCLDDVTCRSSLFAMLGHFSPDGQYGGLRKQNPDIAGLTNSVDPDSDDKQGDFEANNNFSIGLDDEGGFELASDNAIVPEDFALSIFNDNNDLLPNFFIRDIHPDFETGTWRRPLSVVTSGYDQALNYKNQAMFTEDLVNASYQVTDYKDNNGDVIYASIFQLENGSYQPAIVNGAPVEVENDQLSSIVYKVPIRYLADVREFLPYWQEHFPNYLIPYHPEYGYYVECTGRKDLNAYVEGLIDIVLPEDDINGEYVKLVAGESNLYIPDILVQDPIFTSDKVPEEYKVSLTKKLNEFQLNFLTVTPEDDYHTMAQTATIMVNCPDPTSACKNPGCESGVFVGDKIDEWAIFKGLYLSERQKILKEISTRNAIAGMYYNGCIGTKEYSASPERALLFASDNKLQYSSSEFEEIRKCGFNALGIKLWCKTVTVERKKYIRAINPNQSCNDKRAILFKEPVRLFYPTIPGFESGDFDAGSGTACYAIQVGDNNTGSYTKTPCSSSSFDKGAILSNVQEVRAYQKCGHCPSVTAINDFVSSLLSEELLHTSIDNFNCVTNDPNIPIGVELSSYVSTDPRTLLNWSSSYAETSQLLTGLVNSNGGTNTLALKLNFSQSGISNLSDAVLAPQIISVIKIAGIEVDPNDENVFRLSAYIEFNKSFPDLYQDLMDLVGPSFIADNGVTNKQVYLYKFPIVGGLNQVSSTGISPIDLSDCDFAPVCKTSVKTKHVLGVLNSLSYKNNRVIDGEEVQKYNLDNTSVVPLDEFSIYEIATRELLGVDGLNDQTSFSVSLDDLNVEWKVTSHTSSLIGDLTYTENAVDKKLEITIIPITYTGIVNHVDFSKVVRFSNIRPFDIQCSSGTCLSNKFYADVINKETIGDDVDASVYHKVLIEVKSYTDGSLEAIQPEFTQCEKIITE